MGCCAGPVACTRWEAGRLLASGLLLCAVPTVASLLWQYLVDTQQPWKAIPVVPDNRRRAGAQGELIGKVLGCSSATSPGMVPRVSAGLLGSAFF